MARSIHTFYYPAYHRIYKRFLRKHGILHSTESTVKKKLNPDFTITNETQENVIHCILHARRLTTLHEGLRWQDIKRYGITIYRRLMNDNGTITVTDKLEPNDPRRAIQIPSDVISAGLKPNPRTK